MATRKGKGGAFMKPVKISKKLEAVIGKGPIPRGQIMKKLWNYIKRHQLQSDVNRKCIELDDKLSIVFKPTTKKIKARNGKLEKIPKGCIHMTDIASQLSSGKHVESKTVKPNPKKSSSYEYDEEEEEDEYDIYSNPEEDYDDEEEEDEYEIYSNPEEDYDDEEDEEEDDYDDY
jgi:hypothetical protein